MTQYVIVSESERENPGFFVLSDWKCAEAKSGKRACWVSPSAVPLIHPFCLPKFYSSWIWISLKNQTVLSFRELVTRPDTCPECSLPAPTMSTPTSPNPPDFSRTSQLQATFLPLSCLAHRWASFTASFLPAKVIVISGLPYSLRWRGPLLFVSPQCPVT